MKIAVVDGQGGGIGKSVVEKLKLKFGNKVYVTALGTNALATSAMLKAGADEGATGENAIMYNVKKVKCICGPIGLVSANALLGELSPRMAMAISESEAVKLLIPFNKCNTVVLGVEGKSLGAYIDELIDLVAEMIKSDDLEG
ncbi:DUF3842 family protein [Fusibacter bizertensis]|uniref:DUF3842 family protein n=1 Tax=Fusibacter bizertensis TaxID=1488331 RepID=A0ABT6NBU0_9FIRM|nr:DUF3842 family protein [Fusibacter bizertensis]MDH8677861.1 DUF3842 family protein [Fusibacter bizertensis]